MKSVYIREYKHYSQSEILEILGNDFTQEILERKGLDPTGYIKFESQLNDQAYNQEIARMKAMEHQNRHGTMILRGADFKSIGITSEDMQYADMIRNIRDRIFVFIQGIIICM